MVDSARPVPQFVTTGVRVHSKLDKLGYHHQRNIIVTVILVIFILSCIAIWEPQHHNVHSFRQKWRQLWFTSSPLGNFLLFFPTNGVFPSVLTQLEIRDELFVMDVQCPCLKAFSKSKNLTCRCRPRLKSHQQLSSCSSLAMSEQGLCHPCPTETWLVTCFFVTVNSFHHLYTCAQEPCPSENDIDDASCA